MILIPQHDPLGNACLDFINGDTNAEITVHCNIADDDVIHASYLFRDNTTMPMIERTALSLCKGKVLDMGAGVGCHAIALQENNIEVEALEYSKLACDIMRTRGVRNIHNENIFEFTSKHQYDTILMLMNGIGIAGTLNKLSKLFAFFKRNLAPGGQVLIDSADISYLFESEDEDEIIDLPDDHYYGEVKYKMEYKTFKGKWFQWLFIDFELLSNIAQQNGFEIEKIVSGSQHDYLAKIYRKE